MKSIALTPKEAAVLRCMTECDFIQDHADSPDEWTSIGCPMDEVADRYAEDGFNRDGLGGVVRSLIAKGLVNSDAGRNELFLTSGRIELCLTSTGAWNVSVPPELPAHPAHPCGPCDLLKSNPAFAGAMGGCFTCTRQHQANAHELAGRKVMGWALNADGTVATV